MRATLFIAISALVLLTACNGGKRTTVISKKVLANPAELNGAWQLNYISNVSPGLDSLYPGEKPRVTFNTATSAVYGHTGCNSFSGTVSIDESHISFSQSFTMTKKFCPGRGEFIFIEALKKTRSWAVTDVSTLNLIMGDTSLMRFTKIN